VLLHTCSHSHPGRSDDMYRHRRDTRVNSRSLSGHNQITSSKRTLDVFGRRFAHIHLFRSNASLCCHVHQYNQTRCPTSLVSELLVGSVYVRGRHENHAVPDHLLAVGRDLPTRPIEKTRRDHAPRLLMTKRPHT